MVVKTDFFAESPRPSAFEHEADVYELHLWDLQDKAIPRCYGLFRYDGEDDKISSFLVLGDCGDPIPPYKSKVIDAVYFIHFAGFTHEDLSYRNILNKDGCPFIIDLETAKPHVCGMKEKIFIVQAWAKLNVKLKGLYTFLRMDLRPGNMDYLLSLLIHRSDDTSKYRPCVEKLVEEIETTSVVSLGKSASSCPSNIFTIMHY
ncbi:hypothetical protein CCMSSC00406_0009671 [Pleurotus cornucopiae]|uniref:Uncharacterized protein n=1 Tax=Pleurotus cornucopiae TaxID=5321 RepID=A0ACB7JA64_PLECO|nr:hypothetical protein CCMSSC00406_0009671 [Pleurotus cornucopiae]